MTPKQQAEEIYQKYISLKWMEYKGRKQIFNSMTKDAAKQCALICVDEMLSLGALVGSDLSDKFYIYWQEVKQEIEKL